MAKAKKSQVPVKRHIEAKVGGRWWAAKIREDAEPMMVSEGKARRLRKIAPGFYPESRAGLHFEVEVYDPRRTCRSQGNRVVHEDCIRELGKRKRR